MEKVEEEPIRKGGWKGRMDPGEISCLGAVIRVSATLGKRCTLIQTVLIRQWRLSVESVGIPETER